DSLDQTIHFETQTESRISNFAWSPNGQQLAASTLNPENALKIWDLLTHALLFEYPDVGIDVLSVGWNYQGQILASAAQPLNGYNGILVNATTFEITRLNLPAAYDLEWRMNGEQIAFVGINGITVTRSADFSVIFDVPTELDAPLVKVAWHPQRDELAAITVTGRIRIWQLDQSEPLVSLIANQDLKAEHSPSKVNAFYYSRFGNRITVITADGKFRVWESDREFLIDELQLAPNFGASLSPTGTRLALATSNNFDLQPLQITVLHPNLGTLQSLAVQCHLKSDLIPQTWQFDRWAFISTVTNADWLSLACKIDLIAVVNAIDTGLVPVSSVEWAHDGRYLALGMESGAIEIWDTLHEQRSAVWITPHEITGFSWSPDQRKLAVGHRFEVSVWDVATGTRLFTLRDHIPAAGVLWSADGQSLLTTTYDPDYSPTLRKWDGETGELITSVSTSVGGLSWRSQHHQFFAGTGIRIAVFDHATLQNIGELGLDPDYEQDFQATTPAFSSPDGRFAAIGYLNGWVRVWEVDNGTIVHQFEANERDPNRYRLLETARVTNIAFDGEWLTSITRDGTTRTWDLTNSRLIQDVNHGLRLGRSQFSPYGGRLVTSVSPSEYETSNFRIVVLAPSVARLNHLRDRCVTAPYRDQVSIATPLNLGEFVTEVEALSEDVLPLGCRLDLIAMAEALK
ncbi:MAG: WD40 repeat domain-containing protein, partial [Anaerolineae bacterium]|nr:WD40 repeat domain-containing protein [Anaerolineae bacterium]